MQEKLKRFKDYLNVLGLSSKTVAAYISDIRQFLNAHGENENLTQENITDYLLQYSNATTRARKRSALLAYARFINDEHAVATLSAMRIKLPHRLPRPIPADKVREIMAIASQVEAAGGERHIGLTAAVGLMLYVGLRASEVLSLRINDFNLSEKTFRVRGKGNKERVLPIPDKLMRILKNAIRRKKDIVSLGRYSAKRDNNPENPLLYSPTYRTFERKIKEIGILAGVDLVSHMLRHTAATHALQKTGNLRTVQKLLGHKDPRSTAIYTKVTVEDLRKAVD